jgi:transposase
MSTPDERIAELEGENQRQREQIAALLARVQELEARLAKDSHNSSKPPSSDGLKRKTERTKSLRQKSAKKPGGQLGHRGETLRLVATPDAISPHRPAVCAHCQASLVDAPLVLRERRQVHELPPRVRLVVTEHQALHLRCPACAHVSVGAFPAEAPSRAQYGPRLRALAVYLVAEQHLPLGRTQRLLADLFSVQLGRGTLVSWVQQAAQVLEPVEQQIKAALGEAPVLHHDETGVRRAGKLAWAHVTSTSRLTHYAVHAQRGHTATDAIGILPSYRGVSVHDGWVGYHAYTACRHALCNVHHLRELTFLEEQYHQAWAHDMNALLREMKAATDQARRQGMSYLSSTERADFVARYQALLAVGLAANPPPSDQPRAPGQRGRRGRLADSPTRNLLARLLLDQEQVLAFLGDLAIPFDNNQAERDLRGLKIQQKVSGCFRSDPGAAAYATIRGYLDTLRKQGQALLAALDTVFAGRPLYPAFA